MCTVACKMKWISFLLKDFKLQMSLPFKLCCDNEAIMAIAKNPVFHERTKYIEIDCHIVRTNMVIEGFLNV